MSFSFDDINARKTVIRSVGHGDKVLMIGCIEKRWPWNRVARHRLSWYSPNVWRQKYSDRSERYSSDCLNGHCPVVTSGVTRIWSWGGLSPETFQKHSKKPIFLQIPSNSEQSWNWPIKISGQNCLESVFRDWRFFRTITCHSLHPVKKMKFSVFHNPY